jgi:hypothetical protein
MKIYVPWSGQELPRDFLRQIGEDMGIRAEVSATGRRPRLRRACPGTVAWESDARGIPHWEYDVRLFPVSDNYRKWSASGIDNARRVNGVCWHGHRAFMKRFLGFYKEATIRTALAEYNGESQFDKLHRLTNDQQFNNRSTCACAYTQF